MISVSNSTKIVVFNDHVIMLSGPFQWCQYHRSRCCLWRDPLCCPDCCWSYCGGRADCGTQRETKNQEMELTSFLSNQLVRQWVFSTLQCHILQITEVRDLPTKCGTGNFPVWAVKSKDPRIRERSFALQQPFATVILFFFFWHIKEIHKTHIFIPFSIINKL